MIFSAARPDATLFAHDEEPRSTALIISRKNALDERYQALLCWRTVIENTLSDFSKRTLRGCFLFIRRRRHYMKPFLWETAIGLFLNGDTIYQLKHQIPWRGRPEGDRGRKLRRTAKWGPNMSEAEPISLKPALDVILAVYSEISMNCEFNVFLRLCNRQRAVFFHAPARYK